VLHCDRDEKLIPKLAGFAWWSVVKDQWATESRQNAAILDKFATEEVKSELFNEIARQHRNLQASGALCLSVEDGADHHAVLSKPDSLDYRPFQTPAIIGMVENRRTLLADEMGTGKTIEIIGMLNQVDPESVLIVCPASLKLNWLQELEKWYVHSLPVVLHDGKSVFQAPPRGIHIVNYDFLSKWKKELQAQTWSVVIADECHAIKNKKSLRSRAFVKIPADRVVLASGTPILNRPDELWTQVSYLWPEVFDNWHWFVTTYCDATRGKRGFDTTGSSNPKALSRLLKRMGMIRRLKKDVMPYLPPKERQIIEVPVDDMTMFNLEFEVYNTWLAAQSELAEMQEVAELHKTDASFLSKMKMLTKTILVKFSELSQLRHDTAVYKIPTVIAHLKSAVAEHKVVVFVHHKDVATALRNAFERESVQCVGGMSAAAKNSAVHRFQNHDDCMLFIGSSAAGVGLTLTASSHVVMAELDWTPAIVSQKEDRCHRDGQKDSVLVQHIVLQGSIDAMMAHKIVAKQAVIDAALGDT